MKKYFVCVQWGYNEDGQYEECGIRYSKEDDFEWDLIGRAGNEGIRCSIADSLEEALLLSHFNPMHIQFELDDVDMIIKEEILKDYEWDYYYGLIKKEK